ncbi:hypothetical protein K491DRAFT_609257 [Lophiostoma macrostomum CBS 122681]|uniref:Uncharacterized protein n=1 Tax=Lophiostoma macrostomum CBS 122681 TaxID=1314788 RepID=A0A6A6SUV1_9PLEO|nr:hypothetical protein K491DRAFT_609257 [Lophiostoma macrostomum CBS 122681]
MSNAPIHSTGRGGAGNIGPDEHVYTDGGITREGVQGQSHDGEFSTGRGGAGNIGRSPQLAAQDQARRSQDFIPETSLREGQENFHTGRGGEGNIHKEKYGGHSHSPERKGLGDKVKHALHLDGKEKKHEASPLGQEPTTQ